MCLVEWRMLIIILFAYWEVASIIFLGLHDKLQITKVIYAITNLFCIFFPACVCVLVCVRTSVYAAQWSQHCSISFSSFGVWSGRWMSGPLRREDFCFMVAPSYCSISGSSGRERPGIWRDRSRLAHKSRPWGPRQTVTSSLWDFVSCDPADGAVQQQSLIWAGSRLRYNIPPITASIN